MDKTGKCLANNWLIYYFLPDLKSVPKAISVFGVEFFIFNNDNCLQNPILNRKDAEGNTLSPHFLNKGCACITALGEDSEKALKIALKRVEYALSVLRVYKGLKLRMPVMALVKNLETQEEDITYNIEWQMDKFLGFPFELNQADLTNLTHSKSAIEHLLENNPNTEMTRRILLAIKWVGKATQDSERADRIIKLTIAIECLFINERSNKAHHAAERVARFWSENSKDRSIMYADIKMFYDLRNDIVHGQDYSVSEADVARITQIVGNLVFWVAKEVKDNNLLTFSDFLNFISKIGKEPWEPPKAFRR